MNIFLIWFIIFLCYEVSVCPLLLNFHNVYFASSLIAKPIVNTYSDPKDGNCFKDLKYTQNADSP